MKWNRPFEKALFTFAVPEMSMLVGMAGITYLAYEVDPFNRQGRAFMRLRNTLEFPVVSYGSGGWNRITVVQSLPVLITVGAMIYSIYKYRKLAREARVAGETLEDILSYKNPDLASKVTADEVSTVFDVIEDIVAEAMDTANRA